MFLGSNNFELAVIIWIDRLKTSKLSRGVVRRKHLQIARWSNYIVTTHDFMTDWVGSIISIIYFYMLPMELLAKTKRAKCLLYPLTFSQISDCLLANQLRRVERKSANLRWVFELGWISRAWHEQMRYAAEKCSHSRSLSLARLIK